MFLTRIEVNIALLITIIILGITSVGVTQTLLNKKTINCACLGTTLKLPMTEATFIENAIKIIEWPSLIKIPISDKLEIHLDYAKHRNERKLKLSGTGKWKNFE